MDRPRCEATRFCFGEAKSLWECTCNGTITSINRDMYATSEYLRKEMNPNFSMVDHLNPVHVMSFSQVRGSTYQAH
jgi:hypothetical protein